MSRLLIWAVFGAGIVAIAGCQAMRTYSQPAVTGTYSASGTFDGHVRQIGCRTTSPIIISGKVINNRVTGTIMDRGDTNFDMAVKPDGTFGPQKLYLRKHKSGDDKFKWISGKIAAAHGNSGCVRAVMDKGMPGQSLGTKVKIE